ncbi:hypothetical protein [Caballeronia sp. J97]|uniref:hypothetical protein n=1 Tax=Caballeronia sp. J97 TaxID=2805429 RepID=UPI002AB1D39C|nr:hypothetical protein [Caballeronia sp. J97]
MRFSVTAKHVARKGLCRYKAANSRRFIISFNQNKTARIQIVDGRLKESCGKRGSLASRIVPIGLKMRESEGSTGMRERMPRSLWNTKGTADKMRASGNASPAWTGTAAAKNAKRLATSARAPGIECERCMAKEK